MRFQRVSPFYNASQFAGSEKIDFRVCFFTRLSDAEGNTSGVLSLLRETKFIIGFDYAVTRSSPESFCVLFAIVSEHSVELKWLMKNKHKRLFHSSRVKFHLASVQCI